VLSHVGVGCWPGQHGVRRVNDSTSHFSFDESIAFARRLHGRLQLRNLRSYQAVRMYVAALGLVVREARRNREAAEAALKAARVRGRRFEVRVCRLVAGKWNTGGFDAVWANAAGYIAHPCNGDPPPETWRDAIRYMDRRGGMRRLANLYASRGKKPEKPDDDVYRGWQPGFNWSGSGEQDWYTPPGLFKSLGVEFDLDPASPGASVVPWVPAKHHYTEGGLERDWVGFVWLNPPYGRGVLVKWLEKFAEHGNGVALIPERTSTGWWQRLAERADMLLFVEKRIAFVSPTRERVFQFPIGSCLVAMGDKGVRALLNANAAGLGLLLKPYRPAIQMAAAAD
jgi:hypothetical protein